MYRYMYSVIIPGTCGVLCTCTCSCILMLCCVQFRGPMYVGYRPILDAMKTFAVEKQDGVVDIEVCILYTPCEYS